MWGGVLIFSSFVLWTGSVATCLKLTVKKKLKYPSFRNQRDGFEFCVRKLFTVERITPHLWRLVLWCRSEIRGRALIYSGGTKGDSMIKGGVTIIMLMHSRNQSPHHTKALRWQRVWETGSLTSAGENRWAIVIKALIWQFLPQVPS